MSERAGLHAAHLRSICNYEHPPNYGDLCVPSPAGSINLLSNYISGGSGQAAHWLSRLDGVCSYKCTSQEQREKLSDIVNDVDAPAPKKLHLESLATDSNHLTSTDTQQLCLNSTDSSPKQLVLAPMQLTVVATTSCSTSTVTATCVHYYSMYMYMHSCMPSKHGISKLCSIH